MGEEGEKKKAEKGEVKKPKEGKKSKASPDGGQKRKRDGDGGNEKGGHGGRQTKTFTGNIKPAFKGKHHANSGSKHPMRENRGQTGWVQEDNEVICLCCRKRGHSMKHCPQNPNKGDAGGGGRGKNRSGPKLICFNCGKDGHNLKRCPQPLEQGGLKFAVCFVCKETGHISAKCPKNTHGIYPKGGSCKICGDVWHLAKDCPAKGTDKDKRAVAERKFAGNGGFRSQSAEDLEGNVQYEFKGKIVGESTESDQKELQQVKKKPKVVKF